MMTRATIAADMKKAYLDEWNRTGKRPDFFTDKYQVELVTEEMRKQWDDEAIARQQQSSTEG